ncbi:hypothetical protein F4825DRAFT_442211 [Nemania diffusa]|nr:hypothetical protein F4825DRAFT_442211 [Nemania diffusa]
MVHKCTYVNCGLSCSHKDLKRHVDTVHRAPNASVYHCRCRATTPRNDNHRRHINKCKKIFALPYYRCKCSTFSENKDDPENHIVACQHDLGKRGRPRQRAAAFDPAEEGT